MSETVFLDQRLAPDIFPLLKASQVLTDSMKGHLLDFLVQAPVI